MYTRPCTYNIARHYRGLIYRSVECCCWSLDRCMTIYCSTLIPHSVNHYHNQSLNHCRRLGRCVCGRCLASVASLAPPSSCSRRRPSGPCAWPRSVTTCTSVAAESTPSTIKSTMEKQGWVYTVSDLAETAKANNVGCGKFKLTTKSQLLQTQYNVYQSSVACCV